MIQAASGARAVAEAVAHGVRGRRAGQPRGGRIERFGFAPFDIVLCMGVLYHLHDTLRAPHLLRTVCRDRLILETVVAVDVGDGPVARYHSAASFNGDDTNFWSPGMACVEAMLADVGFALERSRLVSRGTPTHDTGRAMFECRLNRSPEAPKKTDVAYTRMRV